MKVTNETTIYRGVHHDREDLDESSAKNVWSAVHTITRSFRVKHEAGE
jgi:E3 ubiquitin-protein ligase TRIP12